MGMGAGSWGVVEEPVAPMAIPDEDEVTRGKRGRDGGGRAWPGVVGEGVVLSRSRLLFPPMWLEWFVPG